LARGHLTLTAANDSRLSYAVGLTRDGHDLLYLNGLLYGKRHCQDLF